MPEFEEASLAFLSWLSQSGAEISRKISLQDLRQQHAGRGVVATQSIDEDELLFRIPRSAILCVENSILSKELPKATFEALGPWLSLILVMLYEYENKDASNWAPYFNVLPSEFNTLMFWDNDELNELQASAVRNKIGRESADESFKSELVPVIREFADTFFSGDMHAEEKAAAMAEPEYLQLMHKMGSLIMAYAFDVEPANPQSKAVDEEGYASEDEDEALPKGMVPMADMLNADADRNNARLFYEEESLSMKALKLIQAGEEIFNDYGPLPRSDLLRRYGYITDNYAQYDVVEIPLDLILKKTNEFYQTKLNPTEERIAYLEDQGVIEEGYDITLSQPFDFEESMPELIVLAQTLFIPGEVFERLQKKGKLPKVVLDDVHAAQCLVSIIRTRITQYATSLDDDLKEPTRIPQDSLDGSRERRFAMAKLVRMGEKQILRHAEEALNLLIKELTGQDVGSKRSGELTNGSSNKRQKAR